MSSAKRRLCWLGPNVLEDVFVQIGETSGLFQPPYRIIIVLNTVAQRTSTRIHNCPLEENSLGFGR